MPDTYISFYLRKNCIHIFVDALRGIGSPKYICFLMGEDGKYLVLAPYDEKNFHSHRVPQSVYDGKNSLELTSLPLCKLLSAQFNWNPDLSYRVPGKILEHQRVVIFDLQKAVSIARL